MATDVVIRVPTSLSGLGKTRTIAGLERVTARQLGLRPNEMRIKQHKTTREEPGEPGQLHIGPAYFDAIEVVFLSVQPYRTLQEGTDAKRRTVCVSADCEQPHQSVPVPKASDCVLCEYSQWRGERGARKPPPCSENFAFIGIPFDRDDALPFYFHFRRTSAMQAQRFLQELSETPDMQGLHQCVVRIATQQQRSKSGGVTWYVPLLTVVRRIDFHVYHALAQRALECVYTPPVDGGTAESAEAAGAVVEVDAPQAPRAATDDVPF